MNVMMISRAARIGILSNGENGVVCCEKVVLHIFVFDLCCAVVAVDGDFAHAHLFILHVVIISIKCLFDTFTLEVWFSH
jgi:hypothetical protein